MKQPLEQLEVAILLALWRDLYPDQWYHQTWVDQRAELEAVFPRTTEQRLSHQSRDQDGLTREQLMRVLVVDAKRQDRPFDTPATLKKHIGKLLKAYPDLITRTGTDAALSKKGGKKTDVYTLAINNAITWSVTAVIVLHVWNSPGHNIREEQLIEDIEKLQLKYDHEALVVKHADINSDIYFAMKHGYIARYTDRLVPNAETNRLACERRYLRAIASVVVKAPNG